MKIYMLPILVYSLCDPGESTTTAGPDTSETSGEDPTTSSTTTGTTDAPTSTGDEPTTGIPCLVGSVGCECTLGGTCDDGLTCERGFCVALCNVGAEGCPCTAGGACDSGLACEVGTCVEGFSPPCPEGQNADDCCGDGVLDELEDCDMGSGNSDNGECTSRCRIATCGDGVVQVGVEACDGDKACTAECTLKSCGNGVIDDPREWCEPDGSGDPECTDLCTDARKIIFVSSEHYRGGEIGGLEGGDQKCQHLADAEGLPGAFKVWLATDKTDAPLMRFSWSDVPYVDVNGDVLAETWMKIYGSGPAPLITEQGFAAKPSEVTWPNTVPVETNLVAWASSLTGPGGPAIDPSTCDGWLNTNTIGSAVVIDPDPDVANSEGNFNVTWGGAGCYLKAPIICVEQ
jgi:hypothetical protein